MMRECYLDHFRLAELEFRIDVKRSTYRTQGLSVFISFTEGVFKELNGACDLQKIVNILGYMECSKLLEM